MDYLAMNGWVVDNFISTLLSFVALYLAWRLSREFFAPFRRDFPKKGFAYKATYRKDKSTPPPFPRGWYYAMTSDEVKIGHLEKLTIMGSEVIAFRQKNGTIGIIDAHCAHLGAHLGIESKIEVDESAAGGICVVCPFHSWRYDNTGIYSAFSSFDPELTTGQCIKIPGQENVPAGAHLKHWKTVEKNGIVWFWFDPEDPASEPTWKLPVYSEIESGEWRMDGKATHHVSTHISDIPENTSDVAHLNELHHLVNPFPFKLPRLITDNVNLLWDGLWTAGKVENGDEHCAHVPVTLSLHAFGRQVPGARMTIQILLVGPSVLIYDFHTPAGNMRMFECITPIKPLLQKISIVIYSKPSVVRWLAKMFFRAVAYTLHQDLHVWNNKKYAFKPILSRSDRYLPAFRRWYSQFYPKDWKPYIPQNLEW